MKIIKIISKHRRDFYADMQCEHCGNIEKSVSGYDDSYFHNEVIPDMKCKKCGKSSDSKEATSSPKYNDSVII
jgi:primosomal protein N'